MKTIELKNNPSMFGRKECSLAEKIYLKLNEGSLYDIHQIIESIENAEEKNRLTQVFINKYDFDFRQYI